MAHIADFTELTLTTDQQKVASLLEAFLAGKQDVFLLKGYAGSGKTTLIKALAKYIDSLNIQYQLMAPTGRAAKVMSSKTQLPATTIHRGIYSYDKLVEKERTAEDKSYTLTYYYAVATGENANVLIIDEASMVSDMVSQQEFFNFGSGRLLFDLIEYSKIQNENNSAKIIFVGDPAQLPPVGMNSSPALDEQYIVNTYNLEVVQSEMHEVKRVSANSDIKLQSEIIRKSITSNKFSGFDLQSNESSILNINYSSFIECYKNTGPTKIVLSYKNSTALELNEEIRTRVYNRVGRIQKGDVIINSSNNYCLDIMNGEFAIVNFVSDDLISRNIVLYKKGGEKTVVNLRWRWVELLFTDDNKAVEGYILENYLYSNNTNILPEEHQALYVDFKQRHPNLRPKTKEYKDAMYSDDYLNAIKLKYGNAITVHKSQGGEWDNVFIVWDRAQGKKNGAGLQNSDFYRWAYTAITRTQHKMINIDVPSFTLFSKMIFIDEQIQNLIFADNDENSESVNIKINNYKDELVMYGINDLPLSMQHHFVKLAYIAETNGAKIINWQKKGGYEIWYQFEKNGETAGFKFWMKKDFIFKTTRQQIPKQTNSKVLYDVLNEKFDGLINYSIVDSESQIKAKEVDDKPLLLPDYEDKPFLQTLYNRLIKEFVDINISKIESLYYRERYTLTRRDEIAIIDFEYNDKCMFGRVLPNVKKCNSNILLDEVKEIIKLLKK